MNLREILSDLITHDSRLLEKPKQLRALLFDRCVNSHNREVYILMLILETGHVKKIQTNSYSFQLEQQIVSRLYERFGLDKLLATSAIRIWAKVLYDLKKHTNKDTSIRFLDPALEEAISASIYKEKGVSFTLTIEELESLTVLRGDDRGITSLVGIEKLENIEHISLQNNAITDLSPLLFLNNLKTLFIGRNEIHFASAINEFETIQALDLSYNPIDDFEALSDRTLMLMFDTIGEDIDLKAKVYTLLTKRGYDLQVE